MRMVATIALGVSSGFTVLMALFCLFGAIVAPIAISMDPATGPDDPPAWLAAVFYGGIFLVQALAAVLQIRGALAFNKAEGLGAAVLGTVAAFVGGAMCCNGWNLAAGVFLVIALTNPQVRAEFEDADARKLV